MASRLLRWALDLEAQVQGQAGSLCFQERNFTLSVALLSKDELSWNSHEMLKVMSDGLEFIQYARILVLKNLR